MIKCSGKSVLKGIAIGRIYLYKKQEYVLKQETIENPEAEIERMEKAKETATEQLEELYQKALKEAGEEQAMIFDVHKMMLDDADYLDSIRGLIRDEIYESAFCGCAGYFQETYPHPGGRGRRRHRFRGTGGSAGG